MKWSCLPVLVLIRACSSGAQADLQYVKKARSLAWEWVLINDQAAAGRLTPTYVESMHRSLRENLQSTYSSLTRPNSEYGEQIKALIAEPANAAPAALRSHSKVLRQIEDRLESA